MTFRCQPAFTPLNETLSSHACYRDVISAAKKAQQLYSVPDIHHWNTCCGQLPWTPTIAFSNTARLSNGFHNLATDPSVTISTYLHAPSFAYIHYVQRLPLA